MSNFTVYDNPDYALDIGEGKMFHKIQDISVRISDLKCSVYWKLDASKFEVATALKIVHNEKLYVYAGCSTYTDYCKNILGFNKLSAAQYLRVAKTLLRPDMPRSIFTEEGQPDFCMTQLVEMSALSIEELKDLIAQGMIYPGQPVSNENGTRAVIKAYKEARNTANKEAREAERVARLKPLEDDWAAFHQAFNDTIDYIGQIKEYNTLHEFLQRIMDAAVGVYEEGKKLDRDRK